MTLPSLIRRARRPTRRPLALGLLLAAVLWLLAPGVASAHAHLMQADPAPDAVIARAPTIASFVFDEALNPTLTRVRVADSAGRTVAASGGRLAPGHGAELWQLPLPALGAGTYSVFWTSESATDGHVMSSFYTFRVAPHGAAAGMGTVTGVASMAGMGGAVGGPRFTISGSMAAITLFIWLGLMAQALWLGALVIELAVLTPARRAVDTSESRLAWAATPLVWRLARLTPPLIIAALLGEILCLALDGTGGDWASALAPATLGGILSSQNGSLIVLRLVILLVAARLTGHAPGVRAARPLGVSPRRAPQALGIAAPLISPLQVDWESMRVPVTVLAAGYMLVAAWSGHAANVAPAIVWQSCTIDWLHLLCTAAWAGGMAALAYAVLPARHALAPEERARALLPLLDRFSPVAYAAVGVLALSGLYSAMHHLDSPSMLSGTVYGQFLVVKLGLVGLLIVMSGSHVLWLRPRIARAQYRATLAGHMGEGSRDAALVHEGLSSLAARLRLEAWVGAGILLATALMSQTLPADAAPSATSTTPPTAITGMAAAGDLRAELTVAPPQVGAATFTLRIWEHGTAITADTGAAIMHLFPAAQPALRANLTPQATGTRFSVRGSLATTGTWRAQVLVRTVTVNDYRALSFTFVAGQQARFVTSGLPMKRTVLPHHIGQTRAGAMAGM